jgi:hypothetical protein
MKQKQTYDDFLKGLFEQQDGVMTRPAMVGQPAPQDFAAMLGEKLPQAQMGAKMIQPQALPSEDDLQKILGMTVGAAPQTPRASRPKLFGKKYLG